MATKLPKTLMRVLAILAGAALALGLLLYFLAASSPSSYRPSVLSPEQQDQSMHEFINHIQDFGNQAGAGLPFTWTLTEAQANAYLASMDLIGELTNKPIQPLAQMKRYGLSEPAVAMRDGVLTLMIRSDRHKKVISADFGVHFDSNGDLAGRIEQMRIGMVPVPQSLLEKGRKRLQEELAWRLKDAQKHGDAQLGPVPVSRLAKLMETLNEILQGEHVKPEVVWPLGKHRVRIDKVDISEGKLTIRALPIPAASTAPTAGPEAASAKSPR
jgi:hypothetical protein